MKISVESFKGAIPRYSENLLPKENATKAKNVNTLRGSLMSWNMMSFISYFNDTYDSNAAYVKDDYTVYGSILWVCILDTPDPAGEFDESYWFEVPINTLFEYYDGTNYHWCIFNEHVSSVKSPISNDQHHRLYFTGFGAPKFYSTEQTNDPFNHFADYTLLGVPHSEDSNMSFVSGDTGGTDYRAYIYTFVNEFGAEGPPARDANDEVDILSTSFYDGSSNVIITGFGSAPDGYGIVDNLAPRNGFIRLYRTSSTTEGFGFFRFVKEVPIEKGQDLSSLEITDNVAGEDLGEELPSESWYPPPKDLKGLLGLPNGVLVGFSNNTVHFSEPYQPHAWPYEVPFDDTVVGIGAFGTTVVALTNSMPYTIIGQDPTILGKSKITSWHPCESEPSIVNAENSVLFASTDGIIRISQDGIETVSRDIMTPAQWRAYDPETINGTWFDGKYFGFYNVQRNPQAFLIDFVDGGIIDILANTTVYCAYNTSRYDSILFVADRYSISQETTMLRDADEPVAVEGRAPKSIKMWTGDPFNKAEYTWRSKRFITPTPANFSVARIHFDEEWLNNILQLIEDNNLLYQLNQELFASGDIKGALNEIDLNVLLVGGDLLKDIALLRMSPCVRFSVYVDGELRFEKTICDNYPFKITSGYKGYEHVFEVSGFVPIFSITLAQSMEEISGDT